MGDDETSTGPPVSWTMRPSELITVPWDRWAKTQDGVFNQVSRIVLFLYIFMRIGPIVNSAVAGKLSMQHLDVVSIATVVATLVTKGSPEATEDRITLISPTLTLLAALVVLLAVGCAFDPWCRARAGSLRKTVANVKKSK